MNAPHITDEDLLLDYYGEAAPEQRAVMRAHVDTCAECQALDRELRAVLALVDSEPLPEAPPGFERQMWARLEPLVAGFNRTTDVVSGFSRTPDVVAGFPGPPKPRSGEGGSRTKFWSFEFPRWGLAASAAALAVVSFLLGRAWSPAPGTPTGSLALTDPTSVSERLLRTEVEEHFERSQRVLMELVNVDDSSPVMLASDRRRATDLVAAGRLYRRSVEEIGDADTR